MPLVAALGAAADDLDRLQGLVVARLDLGALDLRELVCVHGATISKLDRKYSVTIHNRKKPPVDLDLGYSVILRS